MDPNRKLHLTPLLEIPAVPWDYENETPKKELETHLDHIVKYIADSWEKERPFFIDLLWDAEDEHTEDGRHPLKYLSDKALENGLHIIPVVDMLRDEEYVSAVKQTSAAHGFGVCLRVFQSDLENPDQFSTELDNLLQFLNVVPEDADLILDLKDVSSGQVTILARAVVSLLEDLPYVNRWRTLTLAASAFPINMTGLQEGFNYVERKEWKVWKHIVTALKERVPRLPTFGDYAVQHPEPPELPPFIRMTANIRYTTDNHWLIAKGRVLNSANRAKDQYPLLCQQLIKHQAYCGKSFSWGDEYIYKCAHNQGGPGNATTWRHVGTSHHLAFVVDQISSLSYASVVPSRGS